MKDNVVILNKFASESEARILSKLLASYQIPSFVSNANSRQVLQLPTINISLHVYAKDLPQAREIIKQWEEEGKLLEENISFHDADLEDIQFEQEIYEQRRKANKINWLLLSILLLVIIGTLFIYLQVIY